MKKTENKKAGANTPALNNKTTFKASKLNAIKDVLTHGGYSSHEQGYCLKELEARLLISLFKGEEIKEETTISSDCIGSFRMAILKKLDSKGYVSYWDWCEQIELQAKGINFINAVNARYEYLVNRKACKGDLFTILEERAAA